MKIVLSELTVDDFEVQVRETIGFVALLGWGHRVP